MPKECELMQMLCNPSKHPPSPKSQMGSTQMEVEVEIEATAPSDRRYLLPTTLRPPTQPESAPPAANREATSEGEIRRGDEGGGGGTRKGATVDSPARNRRRGGDGFTETSRAAGKENICGVDRSAKERKIPACRAGRSGRGGAGRGGCLAGYGAAAGAAPPCDFSLFVVCS